jgi:hypothetical protein
VVVAVVVNNGRQGKLENEKSRSKKRRAYRSRPIGDCL